MVRYKILGSRNGKAYRSRKSFSTEKAAGSYAYKKLVYNPSGNTKRKNQVGNIRIVKKR